MPAAKPDAKPATKPQAKSQADLSLRRQPSQARAQQTMQTLFKAAAQILDKEGEGGLTTNKVAAAAGFSIGTLYQYFPSKEVLVRAMAARGQEMVLQELGRYLSELETLPHVRDLDGRELLGQAIRILVRAMAARGQEMVLQELGRYLSELETLPHVRDLDGRELLGQALRILVRGFATGKGLSQSLIRLCWTLEKPDETASAVRQVADRLAIFFERIGHPALQTPSPAQLFVLTRSVIGTLRSASLEKSPLLGSPAFEEALVQMAWALLARPQALQAVGLALGARPIK
jgi:AcrR family transcriptional regulator